MLPGRPPALAPLRRDFSSPVPLTSKTETLTCIGVNVGGPPSTCRAAYPASYWKSPTSTLNGCRTLRKRSDRFGLRVTKTQTISGIFFKFQKENLLPVFIGVCRRSPVAIPTDCTRNRLFLLGSYRGANFTLEEWDKSLLCILDRFGMLGKEKRKRLKDFVEKKRQRQFTLAPG